MPKLFRALLLVPALALAGCATAPSFTPGLLPTDTAVPADPVVLQAPAQTQAAAASLTDAATFVDASAYGQLSSRSKAEVAGAQFNALQFGRVGAPRNWAGDGGQTGSVTVGPYVRVNLIDCRDFTNTVIIGGQSFVKKGTACRETDGHWSVTATKTS
ncbi:MAG: hypothetical protein ABI697_08100 [Devosia sp.]